MRRQLQTWGLGLLAAGGWAVGVARLYADPADPSVDALTLGLAGAAWLLAVVAAGWLAGRDPDAHAGSGAWAGGNVGALAWLLGAAPVLGVWSQRPVLVPTVGPDRGAVMTQAVAEASTQAMAWSSASVTLMIAGGAALGWLAGGRRREAWPAPDGASIVVALVWLPMLGLVAAAIPPAVDGLVDSIGENLADGYLYAPIPWAGGAKPWMLSSTAHGFACGAACVTAALRRRQVRASVGLGAAAVGAWVIGGVLAAVGAAALFPVVIAALGAGVACGASVPLRPGAARPLGVAVLELTPGLATIGVAPSILVGFAVGVCAVGRIDVLTNQGAAAPADPALTTVLLGVWAGYAPAMLAFNALLAGSACLVARLGASVVGGAARGDAAE